MNLADTATVEQLKSALSPDALTYFERGIEYQIKTIKAINLITADRFDLGVKIFFYKGYTSGKQFIYFRQLYKAHLAVWNGFFEATPAKFGADDYIRSFTRLCDSASQLNLNEMIFPIDNSGNLIDGAHRVSIAAALGRDVRVVESTRRSNSYDYQFFKECSKELPSANAELLVDQMAYYLALFKPSVRFICVMPATQGQFQEEIEAAINNSCSVVYKKTLSLSSTLFDLFILNLYFEDPNGWVGSFADSFKGAHEKAQRCFSENEKVTIYFVDNLSAERSIELKKQIRSFFSLSNDSCHINDTHQETINLAGLILNPAWYIFDKLNFSAKASNLGNGLAKLLQFTHETGTSPQDFCIVGSALWALTGCRDCADIDLVLANHLQQVPLPEGIGNHASQQAYYPVSFDEIINDPQFHFWLFGFKFARPELMLQFKRKRNEIPKDVQDIASLSAVFPELKESSGVKFEETHFSNAAQSILEKTIRDQQLLINRLQAKASTSNISELEGLGRKLDDANRKIDDYQVQLQKWEKQVAYLEKALEAVAKLKDSVQKPEPFTRTSNDV